MLDAKELRERKILALTKHLTYADDYTREEIEDLLGDDYLVLTDTEADEMAYENIKDSLWAFNAEFIAPYCGNAPVEAVQAIHANGKCEDNNELFLDWIGEGGLVDLAYDAMAADGRGHFMNTYDGDECESEVMGVTYYIYRMN